MDPENYFPFIAFPDFNFIINILNINFKKIFGLK